MKERNYKEVILHKMLLVKIFCTKCSAVESLLKKRFYFRVDMQSQVRLTYFL